MATARRGSDRIAEIRRTGRRVQGGAWVLVFSATAGADGRLIVALGRKAGPAVTRSRVRRIARECYGIRGPEVMGDVLLMARADVSVPAMKSLADAQAWLCEVAGLVSRGLMPEKRAAIIIRAAEAWVHIEQNRIDDLEQGLEQRI